MSGRGSRFDLYIIEARHPDGRLDLTEPQPESVFGPGAIRGMGDDAMATAIFTREPDAVLDGRHVALWPAMIDPRWIARRKTW